MEKITDVIKYELVDPHVLHIYPLTPADGAIASVEAEHAGGKGCHHDVIHPAD